MNTSLEKMMIKLNSNNSVVIEWDSLS
jgi:hypothetical protein